MNIYVENDINKIEVFLVKKRLNFYVFFFYLWWEFREGLEV